MREIDYNHKYTYEDCRDCLGDELDLDRPDEVLEELNLLMDEIRRLKEFG